MRDWLTTREAADRLGVKPKHVRKMIAAGRLPAQRLAGGPNTHLRIDPDAIDAVLRSAAWHRVDRSLGGAA